MPIKINIDFITIQSYYYNQRKLFSFRLFLKKNLKKKNKTNFDHIFKVGCWFSNLNFVHIYDIRYYLLISSFQWIVEAMYLIRSKLSYGYHIWLPNLFKISTLSAMYNRFLKSIVKNGFWANEAWESWRRPYFIEPCGLYLKNPKHRIVQMIETISFEEFQQQQQLKGIAPVTRTENNNVINMLRFHFTSI